MKRSVFCGLMSAEALILIFLLLAQVSFSEVFSVLTAFPFEQLGTILRKISTSGFVGNFFANVIYFFICTAPFFIYYLKTKKYGKNSEDKLLILLGFTLFAVLHFMINPSSIFDYFGEIASFGKQMLGGLVYSIIWGYAILRLLRIFLTGKTKNLERYLKIMLWIANFVFVYAIFGELFGSFINSILKLNADNFGNTHLLTASYFFLFLQFIVNALPYVLDIFVVFKGIRLLDEIEEDRYSESVTISACELSSFCAHALMITIFTNISLNFVQMLFAHSIRNINMLIQIPVFSVLFVLAALLLSKFISENKKLKDENDQFI